MSEQSIKQQHEDNKQVESKRYGLALPEANLLRFIQDHQAAVFSGVLSTIAITRLGYSVTPNTQFKLSPDLSAVEIFELPTPEQPQPQPQEQASPVVTAPEAQNDVQSDQSTTTEPAPENAGTASEVESEGNGTPTDGTPVEGTGPTTAEPSPAPEGTTEQPAGSEPATVEAEQNPATTETTTDQAS